MSRDRERSRKRDDEEPERKKKSVGFRGSAGIDRVEEERQRAEDRRNKAYAPFRYRASYERDAVNPIIILDASVEEAFFCHEHAVQNSDGEWGGKHEVCVREQDTCPLCQLADNGKKNIGKSGYIMCLTVLDLTPYKNKKTGKTTKHSKKLFVIKNMQQQSWLKTLEKAEKKFGTIRGLYMELERAAKTDAATGKPLALEYDWYGDDAEDKPYSIIDEEDLVAEYGHAAIKSDSGRVLKEKNADIKSFDYNEVFQYPDVEELAKTYGASTSAGSRSDNDDEWQSDRAARGGRGRGRSRDDEDEEEDEKPSRRKTRSSKDDEDDAPKKGRSRRSRSEEDEEEEDLPRAKGRGDEDDAPKAPTRTRKEKTAEVEDEEEADETPKRTRRTKAKAEPEEEEKPSRRKGRKAAEPEDEEAEEEAPEEEEAEEVEETRSRPRSSRASTRKAPPKDDEEDEDEIPF